MKKNTRTPICCALLCASLVALAGCGNGPAVSPGPLGVGAASVPGPGNQASAPSDPLLPTTTPFDQAAAPYQTLWRGTTSHFIPGHDAVASIPTVPTVVNQAGVSQTVAQAWGAAYFREHAWFEWAGQHNEAPGGNIDEGRGSAENSMAICDEYPTALTAATYTPALANAIGDSGNLPQSYAGDSVLAAGFAAPCDSVASENGHSVMFDYETSPFVLLMIGSEKNDPLFGNVWSIDYEVGCSILQPEPAVCSSISLTQLGSGHVATVPPFPTSSLPRSILSKQGAAGSASNDVDTASFTVPAVWDIQFSYDCSSAKRQPSAPYFVGGQSFGMSITVNPSNGSSDSQNRAGSLQSTGFQDGGVAHFATPGTYTLTINTMCSWTVAVRA